MSTSPLDENLVYARHDRLRGAVLIIGVGAVGGFLAVELARLGASPIHLVDFDVLEEPNLPRHALGREYLGRNKAKGLAEQIVRDFDLCEAEATDADFLTLPEDNQLRMIQEADVVVVAAEPVECRERVNEICLRDDVPVVYPAIQVRDDFQDGEIGEIIWVRPAAGTPCYHCTVRWRDDVERGGTSPVTRTDVMTLVLATTKAVTTLLNPETQRPPQFLDVEHTFMFVRDIGPSPNAMAASQREPIRYVRVPFPPTPCRICQGQAPPDPELERQRQRQAERERHEAERREAAARAEQVRVEAAARAERLRMEAAAHAEAEHKKALEQFATKILEGPDGLANRYAAALEVERATLAALGSPFDATNRLPPPPIQATAVARATGFAAILPRASECLRALSEQLLAVAPNNQGHRASTDLHALAQRLLKTAADLSGAETLAELRSLTASARATPNTWHLLKEAAEQMERHRQAVTEEALAAQARAAQDRVTARQQAAIREQGLDTLAKILTEATDLARLPMPNVELTTDVEFDSQRETARWRFTADPAIVTIGVWRHDRVAGTYEPDSAHNLTAGYIFGEGTLIRYSYPQAYSRLGANIVYDTLHGEPEWLLATIGGNQRIWLNIDCRPALGNTFYFDPDDFAYQYGRSKRADDPNPGIIQIEPLTPESIVQLLVRELRRKASE